MDILIWAGAIVSIIGLGGVIWCILQAMKARKANLPDEELRARLQKVVAVNMGALLFSILGLMMIVIGIFLG